MTVWGNFYTIELHVGTSCVDSCALAQVSALPSVILVITVIVVIITDKEAASEMLTVGFNSDIPGFSQQE